MTLDLYLGGDGRGVDYVGHDDGIWETRAVFSYAIPTWGGPGTAIRVVGRLLKISGIPGRLPPLAPGKCYRLTLEEVDAPSAMSTETVSHGNKDSAHYPRRR
jgi:hypothetical protein